MDLEYKITNNKYDNIKQVLKEEFHISDRLLKKLKLNHQIFLNYIPVNINYSDLKIGNLISIVLDFEEEYDNIVPLKSNLNIIYEDNYLLVVNKPSNMPVHPSCNHFEDSLSNIVKYYFDCIGLKRKIRIVNRLDKDTSGIVIFAKNEYIQELFVRRKDKLNLKKEYIAIVNGIITEEHGIIEKNIARMDNTIILRHTVIDNTGDYAKTEYNVLSRNEEKNYTVVNVLLHTGRTHQIRVHMIDLGHILLGDTLYAEHYGIHDIDKLISRQALHAHSISFNHPITDEFIQIHADIPNDMKNLI